MLVDIVRAAYHEVGVEVEFKCFPWARAMQQTQDGSIDITFPWSRNKEREKLFLYSSTVMLGQHVLFHLKSRSFPELNQKITLEGLSRYKVGGTIGYYYGPMMKQYDEQFGIERAVSDKNNLKKLVRGRIDLFIAEFMVGYYLISQLPDHTSALLTNIPVALTSRTLHLLVGKKGKNPDQVLSLFEKGLKAIRENGTEKKILEENVLPGMALPRVAK
ncbi:substrate-binding periplasmic protein [Dongshaea marina]|uniref:substrate-binding periplasmic protein n=1 Tax=Dongshaea marina TaxID=2047966 RepID=UPI00131F44AD|nr:transporter substrate-binding domain-containing protein [Dongshaea marina]